MRMTAKNLMTGFALTMASIAAPAVANAQKSSPEVEKKMRLKNECVVNYADTTYNAKKGETLYTSVDINLCDGTVQSTYTTQSKNGRSTNTAEGPILKMDEQKYVRPALSVYRKATL